MSLSGTREELRDLVLRARANGATALHLRPGTPVLQRLPETGLTPIAGEEPLAAEAAQRLFSVLVDPDEWDTAEEAGEGSGRLSVGDSAPVPVVVFRAANVWCFVVHLI